MILPIELNKLVRKADKKRNKRDNSKFSQLKTRVEKSPSRFLKPESAPEWTYKSESLISSTDSTVDTATTPTASTVITGPASTPQRNPTGGAVARHIFSDTGSKLRIFL